MKHEKIFTIHIKIRKTFDSPGNPFCVFLTFPFKNQRQQISMQNLSGVLLIEATLVLSAFDKRDPE